MLENLNRQDAKSAKFWKVFDGTNRGDAEVAEVAEKNAEWLRRHGSISRLGSDYLAQTSPSPKENQRVVVVLRLVKNSTPSFPWMWRSPKKESFQPLKGK